MARIAIGIEDVHRRGGQERVICELLWRLADRHDIDLVCYRAEDIPKDKVRVVPVRERFGFSILLRALWFIPASSRRVRREKYDAVLSQGSNMWNQTHVLAHTCHAQRMRDRREHEWRERPPGLLKRLDHAIRDRLLAALERRTVRRCRGRAIAVGEVLKRNLVQYHGLADEDVLVANNGVNHETFHPGLRERWRPEIREQLGLSDDTFVALFVGGRWQEKGLPLLIEALALMEQKQAKLVVVGRGDEEAFGQRAEALGVGERVVFAGVTPSPERYYAMADCFVFLSKAEGLALVQMEAAACGLPLVLAETEAPPGLVEDGVSGFVVPRDPAPLAQKLDALASDREFCRRAGEASHRNSLQFSWDRQAEEIESFILG